MDTIFGYLVNYINIKIYSSSQLFLTMRFILFLTGL